MACQVRSRQPGIRTVALYEPPVDLPAIMNIVIGYAWRSAKNCVEQGAEAIIPAGRKNFSLCRHSEPAGTPAGRARYQHQSGSA